MLRRFSMLIVLDGLDEVARTKAREVVVTQLNELTVRLATGFSTPRSGPLLFLCVRKDPAVAQAGESELEPD